MATVDVKSGTAFTSALVSGNTYQGQTSAGVNATGFATGGTITETTVFNGGTVTLLDVTLNDTATSATTDVFSATNSDLIFGGSTNTSGSTFNLTNSELTLGGTSNKSDKINLSGSSNTVTLSDHFLNSTDGETITWTGFQAGDQILLASGNTLTSVTSTGTGASTVFDIHYTSGGVAHTAYLESVSFAGGATTIVDVGGVLETATCYCRGTNILTDVGEVAVEDLKIGDKLVTVSGAARPIRWIGRSSYAGRFAANNSKVLPVLIKAGALADNVPARDLYVSPAHAMFLDGSLIPASALVNGSSILQLASVDTVEYFHVELETHDVIIAEGAASESFVDDDSRNMFHNVAEYHAMFPEALSTPAQFCAPVVEDGEQLEAIRAQIAVRLDAARRAA